MKKVVAILLCASAFATGPAFAQDKTSLDPATVAATRELFDSMNMRQVMMASMQRLAEVLPQQMKAELTRTVNDDPRLTPEQKQKLQARLEQELPKRMASMNAIFSDPALIDEVIAETIPLYAKIYTTDEIHQIAAFYRSPVGQKTLATMPKIMVEAMEVTNRIMMPRVKKTMEETAHGLAEIAK
jgi:hypothetical protein